MTSFKILSTHALKTPWPTTRNPFSELWLLTAIESSASSKKKLWAGNVKVSQRYSLWRWLATIIATSLRLKKVTFLKKSVKRLFNTIKQLSRLSYLLATLSSSALPLTSLFSKKRWWITQVRPCTLLTLPYLRPSMRLTSLLKRNLTTPSPSFKFFLRTQWLGRIK